MKSLRVQNLMSRSACLGCQVCMTFHAPSKPHFLCSAIRDKRINEKHFKCLVFKISVMFLCYCCEAFLSTLNSKSTTYKRLKCISCFFHLYWQLTASLCAAIFVILTYLLQVLCRLIEVLSYPSSLYL